MIFPCSSSSIATCVAQVGSNWHSRYSCRSDRSRYGSRTAAWRPRSWTEILTASQKRSYDPTHPRRPPRLALVPPRAAHRILFRPKLQPTLTLVSGSVTCLCRLRRLPTSPRRRPSSGSRTSSSSSSCLNQSPSRQASPPDTEVEPVA